MTVPDKYEVHRDEFLQLLSEFEDMWNGHLTRIEMAIQQNGLTANDIRPVDSVSYQEFTKVRQLAAMEVQEMLQEEI